MLIYLLYRLLGIVAFPLILVYLLRRGVKDRRYWQGMGERFGNPPAKQPTLPGGIWLHAVSVGEIASAVELIRQLRQANPYQPIHVTVTTVAGRQLAETKLQGLADSIFFLPFDYVWMLRRVLRRLRPRVVVVMETEIWPNLFREAKRAGCGLIVVNGRISDRAFPRYQEFGWFFRPVLAWPDRILVQNEVARERYVALGAAPDRVEMAGNLKYDLQVRSLRPPGDVMHWIASLQPRRCWIAASTMPPAFAGDIDEDDVVIGALPSLHAAQPGLLTILVPRRPERFDVAWKKLEAAGIRAVRRTQLRPESLPCVLLLDSVGEMVSLFVAADCVFMGGTLAERGGHNILEPAFFAKPVVIGPHMENFPDIGAEFRASGAVAEIHNGAALAATLQHLLADSKARHRIGERARQLAESKRGATARAVAVIAHSAGQALPPDVHPLPWRMAAALLGTLWHTGLAVDRWAKQRNQSRLPIPVISVGGIAVGGVGKTPVAAWLAAQIAATGRRPAILTRGYGRRSQESSLILAAGETAPVDATGEEAQILMRPGHTILGIGADRAALGRQIVDRFHPDVFLLDDGFQHWRLHRDLDLVLLDALDPFGRGALLPLGRLREPIAALRRASVILVTRTDALQPWPGLEARIRNVNPSAPIFYCRVAPVAWMLGRKQQPPPEGPYFAFCGLGNPASFQGTLRAMDLPVAGSAAFPDHHPYQPADLRRLTAQARAAGCRALLTTEKDYLNLPGEQEPADLDGLPLYWLHTTLEIDRERAFLDTLGLAAGTTPVAMGRPVY